MNFDPYLKQLDKIIWGRRQGYVRKVSGLILECTGIAPRVGELCIVSSEKNQHQVTCEVIGIREKISILMPLADTKGIGYGDRVSPCHKNLTIQVGDFLKGMVLNGYGQPMDQKISLPKGQELAISGDCPNPLARPPIRDIFETGIKAIDALLTCGKGQRIGVFAGSGVGKSTLLGSLIRNNVSSISVLALIGERGREVKSFIEDSLGKEGLSKSVLVVATSDTSPLQRLKGILTALTIAEYFRDLGNDVLFLCDSVTRAAMAIREIGLSRGEPPTLRGYPPSLYSILSKIVERLGNTEKGSITGIFTVLVEGDDFNEPVADTMRSLLDGHIVLTRELAHKGHFPAIDILQSSSRLMNEVVEESHQNYANHFRELQHSYQKAEELINIGAYKAGGNPIIDEAIQKRDVMNHLLRQGTSERVAYKESFELLKQIMS